MPQWLIPAVEIREVTLDFSSSGQGRYQYHAAYSDGIRLFNAIELLQWEDGRAQALVCESCGHSGCEQGSWISIRRLGRRICFIPAIDAMREGEWERDEYSPPRYMVKKGLPMLTENAYSSLQQSCERFPELEFIGECSRSDVIGLLQLSAPARLLGPIGVEPKLDTELIVAVSNGDLTEQVETLERLLTPAEHHGNEVSLEPMEEVVTFYLDMSPFTEWSPFGYISGRPSLNLRAVWGEAFAGDA